MSLLGFAQGDLCGREVLLQQRLAFSQLVLLPGMGSNLCGQWRQQCFEFGFTGELVPLRAELFQPCQLQAFAGQTFPVLLGALKLLGRCELSVLQLTQILEPGVLLLKLFELCLLQFLLLLRFVEARIQFCTDLRRQRRHTAGLILQQFVSLASLLGLVEGATTETGVERRVGEFLQQFAAVVVVGLEECAELALRQHHRAGELFEIQPQRGFELSLVFAFLAGEQLILIDVTQALAAGLQLASGLVPGAIGLPAGAVAAAVDADEIHFRIAFTRAATQQGARVAGSDFAVGVRHLGVAAGVVQARYGAKQRQAQGIEQGAFTSAGGAGDGEQSGTGQGFGGEVDFKWPGQGGEVFQADREDFHGCSLSICTSCNSSAKSLRVCSSTSLP
ncbi:hypothetical protein D3C71_854200 [compost metagenome]